MIGHRTRFRVNDYLPLWRGPRSSRKEKSRHFLMRALISREIMCSTASTKQRLHFRFK